MCKKILLLETVLCSRVTKVQLLQRIWLFAFFIQEYSIVLNLARKVQTLLHKMSFAGSTEDGLYWHVLCLNLENLSRGSRLTFCARFVALYFKKITIFSSVVRVQNNSTGLSKPLRSQTISAAPIHTCLHCPIICDVCGRGLSGLLWSNDIIENCINCRFWQGPRVTASTNWKAKPGQNFYRQ